ncbi:unnamed protein product [Blepharisma stoltei]|uniref:Uncharacterized protein n=1 Tax=Blepharisma stoltei TaxID=1481888 RepID=A0AAU9K2R1_9CILI|nr:unnamed protein product [Blepharisma stoltei]
MLKKQFGKKFRIIAAIERDDILLLNKLMTEMKHDPFDPVDTLGSNILHVACYMGKLNLAKWIYTSLNIDLNICNFDGQAAIHLATINGHFNIVKWLWEMGADCHAESLYYYRTPYYMCCYLIKHKQAPEVQLGCENVNLKIGKLVQIKNFLREKYFSDMRGYEIRKFLWAYKKLKDKGTSLGRLTSGMAREIGEFL